LLSVIGASERVAGEPSAIWLEIARFLRNPHKPAILAIARPDHKKNLPALVSFISSTIATLGNAMKHIRKYQNTMIHFPAACSCHLR
jgi:hypothetical protein